tara:strand:- start:6220 stop:6621 length:402 start_codon:yes stop_codon:yes gene_type:complete
MSDYNILGWDDSKNKAVLFTPWSLIHFLFGYIGMAYVNYFNINKDTGMFTLFIIHTLYEVKDYFFSHVYKGPQFPLSKWSSDNSIYNCFGDSIVFILGMVFAINKNYSISKLRIITILFLILLYLFETNKDIN